ncbi:hypothetical protein ACHAWF_009817 [Thalassiosira exigua]
MNSKPTAKNLSRLLLRCQGTKELRLLLRGLEPSVPKLGAGVDKLEVDGLQVLPRRVLHQRLPQDQGALLHPHHGPLYHNPVLPDHSVVHEPSHGGDALLREVGLRLTAGVVPFLPDAVDLLVHLRAVEVSVLTRAGDGVGDASGVPGPDAGHLAQTAVGLAGEAGDAPAGSDTLVAVSLGDTEDINELVLGEDGVDSDLLLEEALCEVDLGSCVGAAVDLDLHDVGLLDAEVELLHLGVGDDADDLAELSDALELGLDVLAVVLRVLLGVLGVGLALRLVPVLVAPALELLAQVLREDGGEGAKAAGGLQVADDADDDHGGRLEDGDGVHDLALVHDRAGAVHAANDVSHAGLVGAEGREVRGSGRIIVLGEGADAARVMLGALLGEEPQGAAAGSFKLTVGHGRGGYEYGSSFNCLSEADEEVKVKAKEERERGERTRGPRGAKCCCCCACRVRRQWCAVAAIKK